MKHKLNEIWQDKKGEYYIRTEDGTKSYYRFLVEKYLGFEIPKGYSVHHLDFNHSNNKLSNFCIIPTPLHTWLHRTKGTNDLFESNLPKIKKHGYLEDLER